jgi:hypothetical protein
MAKSKLRYLLVVLGIFVVLSVGVSFAASRTAGGNMDKEIPLSTTRLEGCKWNHVSKLYPSQFVGGPDDLVAFQRGYHRLAFCPGSTLDVNVLEYGKAEEAEQAGESAVKSLSAGASRVEMPGRCEGKGIVMLRLREHEGGILYISIWRVGKRLVFVEEETSPSYPAGKALKLMQVFLEDNACR